jgi:hypothetical protein
MQLDAAVGSGRTLQFIQYSQSNKEKKKTFCFITIKIPLQSTLYQHPTLI